MSYRTPIAASVAALAALAVSTATPSLAGDGHHRHHGAKAHHGHAAVAASLRDRGFVSWDEIEWDDGKWEVDDARRANGARYDLKLDPSTLKIVHRERER